MCRQTERYSAYLPRQSEKNCKKRRYTDEAGRELTRFSFKMMGKTGFPPFTEKQTNADMPLGSN
jgi:hypothetical protein